MTGNTKEWWINSIGYQVNTRTFFDGNNDGVGDLEGVIQKLAYIKELGIDFIWINPVYSSPNRDNGYDISDYYSINPEYGDLEIFTKLIKKSHELGIKVVMDLVINHTSDEHPWFKEAKKSRENRYHDYYLWSGENQESYPNNWKSFFGGSVWTYEKSVNQFYFHAFTKHQPDLNWENENLRKEIYEMIEWWIGIGIDGFRLDAITQLKKAPWNYSSNNTWDLFTNVKGIEKYLKKLKSIFKKHNIFIVGESSGVSSQEAKYWTGKEGYFNSIMEWEHNYRIGIPGYQKSDVTFLKNTISRWQNDLAETSGYGIYLENHDHPRAVSSFGNDSPESAKAFAMLMLGLDATVFIYQGQEIGMTNYPFSSVTELETEDTKNRYVELISQGISEELALKIASHWAREHARTAMQWSEKENAGFSGVNTPVLVNPNYCDINVDKELRESDSVLLFFKELITLRKQNLAMNSGVFEMLDWENSDIFIYRKSSDMEELIFVINLREYPIRYRFRDPINNEKYNIRMSSTKREEVFREVELSPFECFILQKE